MERSEIPHRLSQPILLTSAREIGDYLRLMRKAFRLTPEAESEESGMSAESIKDASDFAKHLDPNEYFIGIKDDDRIVAGGALQIISLSGGNKKAYLAGHVVDTGYRGLELAQKITDKSIAIAQEQGCELLEAAVEATNPAALMTKFHNDFEAYNLLGADNPREAFFQIRKYLKKNDISKIDSGTKQWKELALDNLLAIKADLNNGWKAVDLKNKADRTDDNPQNWILILEK